MTGEPDVGKSALTMATISELESEAAIALVNLRDLPTLTIELEHLIDASIVDVLAAMSVAPLRLLVVDGAEAVLEGWSTSALRSRRGFSASGAAARRCRQAGRSKLRERGHDHAAPKG